MTYLALATDYDGTLATDGQVDDRTLAALQRWRDSGRKLILITGRQLDDLLQITTCLDFFDWVVAENGAMLYQPASKIEKLLAERPSAEFIQQLNDRIQKASEANQQQTSQEFAHIQSDYPIVGLGRIIVATWEPYSVEALALIQEMNLDLQVILNKGAVMILPKGIDKEAGLVAAAKELGISLNAIVGVGDAENDLAFLNVCGYSVAVANALPTVKNQVDLVTENSRGAGVIELIEWGLKIGD
ncbi:haloacid dehalogenase [[Phormidium ambiguum] IAM M-71]|uniref:Haloacid dehalogenase n=1 Tax=[Phormidium ambiguum] IAM M-71 TaxID=454136 RepID=A0A1U7IQG0_9CYAN|nr:HAD family hydrolase [Phormidium ambiguum]OKH39654.1 haloacid dehalogenase [Phormidium ambiguum IAM M-71]